VKVRDSKAWQRMVNLHGPVVYGWARRTGLAPADAARVVQDVFHAVAIRVEEFQSDSPHESFRGWLWTLTRNRIKSILRDQASGGAGLEATEAGYSSDSLPLDIGDPKPPPPDAALLGRVVEAIRPDFEDITWDAFWKMAILGKSSSEVAREMGMKKSGARNAKYLVLHRLRQELEQA
jgi:RNA polymerase sigma-70 factor (ECF subfamily)